MLLLWEEIKCEMKEKSFLAIGMNSMRRTKVPGGWLIQLSGGESAFFYPDPEHLWDGSSLP